MHVILGFLLTMTPVVFADTTTEISIVTPVQETHSPSDAYCENLYWQPNAEQNLLENGCDIAKIEAEIQKVQRGLY